MFNGKQNILFFCVFKTPSILFNTFKLKFNGEVQKIIIRSKRFSNEEHSWVTFNTF